MNAPVKEFFFKGLRKLVRFVDEAVDFAALVALLFLLLVGGYSLWDSQQVIHTADVDRFVEYRPTVDDTVSFEELQALNRDVFGWLNIYGTGIDFPMLHCENDWFYLNHAPDGTYSLAGSVFIAHESATDFSDYTTVIHAHHMANSAMFGDLDKFLDREFFDTHRYGYLYADGQTYGIKLFFFGLVDAYDGDIYQNLREYDEEYLPYLESQAMYLRDEGQAEAEHIILMSTCAVESTNGRYLLAGMLTDEVYENEFYVPPPPEPERQVYSLDRIVQATEQIPLWKMISALLAFLIVVYVILMIIFRSRSRRR